MRRCEMSIVRIRGCWDIEINDLKWVKVLLLCCFKSDIQGRTRKETGLETEREVKSMTFYFRIFCMA